MGRGERVGRNVHTGGVNGVLLTADGRRAVTYSKDCTVRACTACCVLRLRERACVCDARDGSG